MCFHFQPICALMIQVLWDTGVEGYDGTVTCQENQKQFNLTCALNNIWTQVCETEVETQMVSETWEKWLSRRVGGEYADGLSTVSQDSLFHQLRGSGDGTPTPTLPQCRHGITYGPENPTEKRLGLGTWLVGCVLVKLVLCGHLTLRCFLYHSIFLFMDQLFVNRLDCGKLKQT